MNIQAIKLDLIRKLTETTDLSILQQMILLFKEEESDWGFTPEGKRITDDMMLEFIQKADGDEKAGRLISQKDLEKEAENW